MSIDDCEVRIAGVAGVRYVKGVKGVADAASVADVRGSQFCIQSWVNDKPDEFGEMILTSSPFILAAANHKSSIEWLSPLAQDNYKEYRDDFLTPLGLDMHFDALRAFWPKMGPQWDSLAWIHQDADDAVLLVEAKAHVDEMSTPCGAKDPKSVKLIRKSLTRVQNYMGVAPQDWMYFEYYQLANRLAFLYFFNEILKVPAFLALVSFVNDLSYKPTSLAQWRQHYVAAFARMGIHPNCKMLDRLIMVFPDASHCTR